MGVFVLINTYMTTFKGFSTINKVKAPYTLTDAELIKRDLLNELYTRKGERVMRPDFGSIVWDILMDPSTLDLDNQIKQDITAIVDRDPRTELLSLQVYSLDHTIRAELDLRILGSGDPEKLYIDYRKDISEGTN